MSGLISIHAHRRISQDRDIVVRIDDATTTEVEAKSLS